MTRRTLAASLAPALIASLLVAIGLITIIDSGWRDPFADQWRLYPIYLELPFPRSVVQLENGHRPILPGLVRVVELYWLDGGQTLQLAIGALAALATVLILGRVAVRDETLAAPRRWLAVAAIAAGIFWLGNGRFLLHGNESVHGYLLTACTAAALALVLRPGRSPGARLLLACLLGMAATFCFGPGIASFGAIAIVLLLDRRYRALPWLAASALATLLLYLALPDAGGVRGVLHLDPWNNLRVGATWLASMWVHLLQPFHDPEAARALPGWLAEATTPVASAYRERFGALWTVHWPATAVGLAGIAYVLLATVNSLRSPPVGPLRACGLALAWFAIGVAGLVALSRLDYFMAHPDQVVGQRYLPWSSLFWTGVMMTALASPSRHRLNHGLAWTATVVLLAGVLASTPAYRAWAQRSQDTLSLQAAGVAMATLPASDPLQESRLDEIERARPLLLERRLAMFAWPELHAPVAPAPPPGQAARSTPDLSAARIDNLFGGQALALSAGCPGDTRRRGVTPPPRLALVDGDGLVIGLLVRQRDRQRPRYAGYSRGEVTPAAASEGSLLAVDADGRLRPASCRQPE